MTGGCIITETAVHGIEVVIQIFVRKTNLKTLVCGDSKSSENRVSLSQRNWEFDPLYAVSQGTPFEVPGCRTVFTHVASSWHHPSWVEDSHCVDATSGRLLRKL